MKGLPNTLSHLERLYFPEFEFLLELTNHLPFRNGVREVKLKWEILYKGILLQGLWIGETNLVCEGIPVRECYL